MNRFYASLNIDFDEFEGSFNTFIDCIMAVLD